MDRPEAHPHIPEATTRAKLTHHVYHVYLKIVVPYLIKCSYFLGPVGRKPCGQQNNQKVSEGGYNFFKDFLKFLLGFLLRQNFFFFALQIHDNIKSITKFVAN